MINSRDEPDWGAKVQAITGGRGVDIVVEVGGPATLAQSIQAARIHGHLALIGVLTGVEGQVPTANLMRRHQRLQGLIVGSRRHQQEMIQALESKGIKPVIDRSYPLAEIAEAFAFQKDGSHFGKIVLEI